ncbi:hypothetical protein P175DRAFT_0559 [Aspergillus ochraceoroseus IBT 24754]|uniref:Zn(2)-C6 fungal-type domain-containing protein n=2 Tax=Aspergillus ochraceoroseus TaxID=138278 RepID=A0A2T5M552_9EURO|nr:uncharacterized protein P175DRAFT_0559 [Aspergillus ochraceoroseus IBT 24754]KKK21425.1 hypothetical protein AOCH_000119 [Aspergillus ochraceoroseus]PTU23678.1 hypothetical protein P175DRAFT_0559 [Aspergillus ochraceoroseus IBT 24754]
MASPTFIVSMPSAGPASSASHAPSRPPPKKRSQVARACDWCRVHRVKCDAEFPCLNCRKRGARCSNDRQVKSPTLPEAYREIERLKQRVEELELELRDERAVRLSMRRLDTPSTLPDDESPGERGSYPEEGRVKKVWEGIHISTARSPNKTWYGPSSLFYFIGSINNFLTTALKQTHSTHRMLPNSASTLLDGPTEAVDGDHTDRALAPTDDPIRAGESLSPMQEEYFLNLFWESYYTAYPILDEREFKEHYQSLWETSEKERKPSALVDIVLAVCMQYGMARLPGGRQGLAAASRGNVNDTDSTIAGRWHYRRCLTLLSGELESPTLSTLQCHILCSIYLCYGSFQNMSDNACGLAVRTAFMLGLHLEPPESVPRRERELRKRIWWILYVLESNRSIKLGRPFILQESAVNCSLPADDREIASLSGSGFSPIGENVTWLSWNLYNTKLMLAARRAYKSIYGRPPDAFLLGDVQPIAEVMESWLRGVPDALKTSRQNHGMPFSTDRSPLQIEQFTPVWLQRQRLLLEVMYHNLCTSLYRPSICFTLAGAPASLTEPAALKCAAHAVALTHIMHQVLSTSSILSGWHEAFHWQWNAAMTLIGFVLAFPQCASTPAARSTIDMTVTVFEHFGHSFAVAVNAAAIMRDLSGKVDLLTQEHLRKNMGAFPTVPVAADRLPISLPYEETNYDNLSHPVIEWPLPSGEETSAEIGGILGHSIDISAETFTDLDWSTLNNDFFDQWVLRQQDIQLS